MIVASRYAKALMQLAVESGKLDSVREDMKTIEQVCKDSREFLLFLESPIIKTDKKVEVLNSVFKGKISDTTLAFLVLVTKKHREALVSHIASAFDEQYKQHKNIFTAVVTSARGLDQVTRQKMLDTMKQQLNGEVELVEKVDPAVIGGFVLKIGDTQINRTIASQLAGMKKQLLNKELN